MTLITLTTSNGCVTAFSLLKTRTSGARSTFAPDGRLAVTADQNVTLWNAEKGRERLTFHGTKHAILTVLFADRGRTLLTLGADKTVRLWDAPGS